MLRDGALDCLPLHQPVFAPPQHERDRGNFKHFFDRRQLKLKPCDCDVFITIQILDDLALIVPLKDPVIARSAATKQPRGCEERGLHHTYFFL